MPVFFLWFSFILYPNTQTFISIMLYPFGIFDFDIISKFNVLIYILCNYFIFVFRLWILMFFSISIIFQDFAVIRYAFSTSNKKYTHKYHHINFLYFVFHLTTSVTEFYPIYISSLHCQTNL